MKPIRLNQLADVLGAKCHEVTPDRQCTGVSNDSRQIKPGDLYAAIRGERLDGHDFVQQAHAVGALVEHYQPGAGPQVVVDNTVTALGRWAQWSRQQANVRVVGITGSVGKTTTREMVTHLLSQRFRCWQSPKNYNNLIGLSLTLLNAPVDSEIIVAELGTNQPREIEQLTRIAQPDIAVVTLAATAHLQGFGNLEGVIEEKLSIRIGLNEKGPLIVNGDCPVLVQGCQNRRLRPFTYGLTEGTHLHATQVSYHPERSSFHINSAAVTIPLAGPGNVQNALAAWAVGIHLDLAPSTMIQALATLPPIAMRSERLQIGTVTVWNDCYNANPASMINALQTLALTDHNGPGRRVFVCGHMAELGPDEERLHAELGPAIAASRVDLLIAVGPLAAHAARAAEPHLPKNAQVHYCEDLNKACQVLTKQVKDYDTVLVKGSRSAGLETMVTALREKGGS